MKFLILLAFFIAITIVGLVWDNNGQTMAIVLIMLFVFGFFIGMLIDMLME